MAAVSAAIDFDSGSAHQLQRDQPRYIVVSKRAGFVVAGHDYSQQPYLYGLWSVFCDRGFGFVQQRVAGV